MFCPGNGLFKVLRGGHHCREAAMFNATQQLIRCTQRAKAAASARRLFCMPVKVLPVLPTRSANRCRKLLCTHQHGLSTG
jgi:hypothetical protein